MDDASLIVEAMHDDLERLADAASAKTSRVLRLAVMAAWKVAADNIGGAWSAAAASNALAQLRQALQVSVAAEWGRPYADRAIAAAKAAASRSAALLRALDKRFGVARPLNFDALQWAAATGERLGKTRLRTFQTSMARYGAGLVGEIEDAVTANAVLGKPWYEVEKLLRGRVEGAIADQQWKIDRIMRTETSAIYNGALLASYEEEDADEEPVLKRLSATFDKVTGADSVAVHGQVRKLGEPFQDPRGRLYQAPPNRPHDREVVLPHRASWGPTPPALGGPRGESAGIRRPAAGASPRTMQASARLTEIVADVNGLRRQRDAGDPVGPLLGEARRRLQEGQVVLAASMAGDRRGGGAGAAAVSGATLSFGGIAGKVVAVRGRTAVLSIGGQRMDLPIVDGKVLGASSGRGSVTVPEALRPMAAAMISAALR